MAGMTAPYASPRFSGAPASQRGRVNWPSGQEGRSLGRSASPLLLLATSAVFVVVASALLLPQLAATFQAIAHPPAAAPITSTSVAPNVAAPAATLALSRADIETVLTYARAMQPEDQLVQMHAGVFAKRSNVQGVPVHGTTVYYDVLPHQSYGPLRSGKVTESQVNIVSREANDQFMVLVYTLK